MARLLYGDPFTLGPKTFLQEILQSFKDNAEKTLIEDAISGRSYTFGEVHQKASAISGRLRELGIRHGDIVVILSGNNAEAAIFLLGLWLSGATASCLNPALPLDEIKNLLETCQSRVLYVGEEYLERVQNVQQLVPWDITFLSPKGESPVIDTFQIMEEPATLVTEVDQPLGRDHTLVVSFTSGTTGVPKGVKLRDATLSFTAHGSISFSAGDLHLNTSPLYWISCISGFAVTLVFGKTLIIAGGVNPEKILQIITEKRPTYWFTGPSVVLDMCNIPDLDRYDLSSLESLMIGGAPIFSEQRKLVTDRLFGGRNITGVIFGSTEGALMAFNKPGISPDSPRFGSVGKTVPGGVIKVVDPSSGEMLPPFTTGEICLKSPAVIKSYINKEITENELDKDGFWHLGDLGYYDDKEFLFYQSRSKEILKYRGYQIAPLELEQVILKHPEVLECAVAGKPCVKDGELPAAFVILKPQSTLTVQELYDFVSSKVVEEKKLRGGIYFMESLPKSNVGKILRKELINFTKG